MKLTRIALGLAIAGLSFGAHATNGYFSHGYGMKSKGMAGAGASTSTDDAFFGANNPAAAAYAGNRLDLGIDLFMPKREATNEGGALAFASSESDNNYFPIPEFGYNYMLNNDTALGVTVYGNGGMNTDYPSVLGTNILGGNDGLGVDLMQVIVAPTLAFKIAPNHSIGIAPLLGYQMFEANGLQAFAPYSSDSSKLTDNGHDSAFGYGVRVGYLGKITPTVTVGAAYATKMNFSEFDSYAGLFAEKGDFDIPENYNIGISWQATPEVKLALDYQRINYSDVRAVGNPVTNLLVGGVPLGEPGSAGFGWDDVEVWKLGVEYKYSKQLTLRGGVSYNNNPISKSDMGEVMFNILAPAVIEGHASAGFTYTFASGNELTMQYTHAFERDLSAARPGFGGGTDKIQMYQDSVGVQYSWKM